MMCINKVVFVLMLLSYEANGLIPRRPLFSWPRLMKYEIDLNAEKFFEPDFTQEKLLNRHKDMLFWGIL